MWGALDVGMIAALSLRAIYTCISTDPNFGWAIPVYAPSQDVSGMILSPWTQDFILSLIGVVTGIQYAINKRDTVDAFWISKKVAKNVTASVLYLIEMLIYYALGYEL